MKIMIKYDYINEKGSPDLSKPPISTMVEVPDEQCEVMVEVDYQNRLIGAEDKSLVKKRSVQEGFVQKPFRSEDEEQSDTDGLEYIADNSDTENRERQYEYEDVCQRLRKILKPEYAEVIISVVLDGLTPEEYAIQNGEKRDTVYKRLQRAKQKINKIL